MEWLLGSHTQNIEKKKTELKLFCQEASAKPSDPQPQEVLVQVGLAKEAVNMFINLLNSQFQIWKFFNKDINDLSDSSR